MGLPRYILRWILSLQLSTAVKNPRRDFSNGFLVAEILSKYFPADVSMHSFENGVSQAQKHANWDLIATFLAAQGITLTHATQGAIIAQDQSAVEQFLQNLHSFIASLVGAANSNNDAACPTSLPPEATMLSDQSMNRHATMLSDLPAESLDASSTQRAFAFGGAATPARNAQQTGYRNTQHGKAAPMLSSSLALAAQPMPNPPMQQQQQRVSGNTSDAGIYSAHPVGHRNTLHGKAASILGSSIVPTMQGAVNLPVHMELPAPMSLEEQQAALQRVLTESTPFMQAMMSGFTSQESPLPPAQAGRAPSTGAFNHSTLLASAAHGHPAALPASAVYGSVQGGSKGTQKAAAAAANAAAAHDAISGYAGGSSHRPIAIETEMGESRIAGQQQGKGQGSEAGDFQPRTLGEWREDVNNPKSPAYRYWQLGKLVPVESPETAAKREAVNRARDYGAHANERAKAICARRSGKQAALTTSKAAPLEPSKSQRAKAFAQTIKRPSAPRRAPPAPGELPAPPPRQTVSRLLERHESAAQRVDAIREDLARWDLESQERERETKDPVFKALRAKGSSRKPRQEVDRGVRDVQALGNPVEVEREAAGDGGSAGDLPGLSLIDTQLVEGGAVAVDAA